MTKIKPTTSKVAEIHIDKNHKFGKKQRFKPLEKLEEKHLQEDDSIDSIELSISYGPTYMEEVQIQPNDDFSSPEIPHQSSNKKQYQDLFIDEKSIKPPKIPQTQRHSPKRTFDSPSPKFIKPITPKAKNPNDAYKRPVATQPKRGEANNKHSLGFAVVLDDSSSGGDEDKEQIEGSNMFEQMQTYHHDIESNVTPAKIASQRGNINSHIKNGKSSPKNYVDSIKKQQKFQFETKNSNKQIELQYDNDLQKFQYDYDRNYGAGSDDSYPEVEIEKTEESYVKKTDNNFGLESKMYSKTFESHLTSQPTNKHKHQDKDTDLKPILKKTKSSKIKRFRSPKAVIERLEHSNHPDNLQNQREAYKRMRRRSGKMKPQLDDNNQDTENLKQEYFKLKQQLMELEKLKPKSKKTNNEKSNRNYPQNDKKITINPHNERENSKYVRFNVDERSKRGKTPNYNKGNPKEFYFGDESNSSHNDRDNNKDKERLKEISMQYNHSRHNNSLLICKINKVENLKIVHTSEQKQHRKRLRKDDENRRVQPSTNMGSRKYSKQPEADDYNIPQPNNKFKRSPSYRNTNLEDKNIINKSANRIYKNNKNAVTRNNEEENAQSKTFSSHAHHKSSNDIQNPKINIGNAFNSKLIEMSKKKHRKDMKSGDHIKHNNFKFMNVNWLNQNVQPVMPPFYANQQANNASNLLMFQQMSNMGFQNNQQELNAILNQNQLGNNQSLLIYDQQTNSIIPVSQAFGNQMNKMMQQNPGFTPGNVVNKTGIEDTPNSLIMNTAQKNRHGEVLNEQMSNIPFYLQDAKMKLEMSTSKVKTPSSKRGSNYGNNEIPALKFDMDHNENNSNSKKLTGESSGKNTYLNSESAKMSTMSHNNGIKDSLNNRLQSGFHAIEISKLKASDFDLNNRESESFHLNNLVAQTYGRVPQEPIKEANENFESVIPKNNKTVQNTPKNNENAKNDTLIWIKANEDESKNIDQRKKVMEERLNQRKKTDNSVKNTRSKSHNKIEVTSDSEIAEVVNESINEMPEPKSYLTKITNTNLKTRAMKHYGNHNAIVVDLMSTQDIISEAQTTSRVLESCDNPISSMSSKNGLMNFKAFQNESVQRPKLDKPIIITEGSKLEDTMNSSLADMFMK